MRLTLAIGGCTVEELKERMSAVEFLKWLAYFDIRPFGVDWDDVRSAFASAKICAALTGKTQKVVDHIAHRKSKKQSRDEVAAMARLMKAQNERMSARG